MRAHGDHHSRVFVSMCVGMWLEDYLYRHNGVSLCVCACVMSQVSMCIFVCDESGFYVYVCV